MPFTGFGQSTAWQQDAKWDFAYQQRMSAQTVEISLRFPEGDLQKQILLTGFTFWVAPKGKKKQAKGILYPIGLPSEQIPRNPGTFTELVNTLDLGLRKQLLQSEELLLIGFDTGKENDVMRVSLPDLGEIVLDCNFDSTATLYYTVQLPLSTLNGASSFRWGWETGGLPRPELKGEDAIGISGGAVSNPKRNETREERAYARLLETYRFYASPTKWWSPKIKRSP